MLMKTTRLNMVDTLTVRGEDLVREVGGLVAVSRLAMVEGMCLLCSLISH